MKYGKLTLGQIEALVNFLGGEKAVRDILGMKVSVGLVPKEPLCRIQDDRTADAVMAAAMTHKRIVESRYWKNNVLNPCPEETGKVFDLVAMTQEQLCIKSGAVQVEDIRDIGVSMSLKTCMARTALVALMRGHFDHFNVPLLFPLQPCGKTTHLVVHPAKNGFLHRMSPDIGNPFVPETFVCVFQRA